MTDRYGPNTKAAEAGGDRLHEWTTNDKYVYEWCRICLKVRQADGSSDAKPCKGPSHVTTRDVAGEHR